MSDATRKPGEVGGASTHSGEPGRGEPGRGAPRRPRPEGSNSRPNRSADPRTLAIDALVRIERDNAYANLALPSFLDRVPFPLDRHDRGQITDLVYGTVRMRRACDFLVDRFLPDPTALALEARCALRIGAYQLHFGGVPPHAAVSATVGATPVRYRKLVNAVLRRVSDLASRGDVAWPDDATRLSYPEWIVDRLVADLGREQAIFALETMNEPPVVTHRSDGYVQDRSSQFVVDLVGAIAADRVLDVCAAPGGKATGLAALGASVVASDSRVGRLGLVMENRERSPHRDRMTVLAADARYLPYASGVADRVLVDAPCSGLGALRRRPDARWRIQPSDIGRLADLQLDLLDEAVRVLRPGGTLVYSVCTLTRAETVEVAAALVAHHPELVPIGPPAAPWEAVDGGGALLVPGADHDGMAIFRWTVEPGSKG